MNILFVDDEILVRAAIGPMLECLGHQAVLASSGEEALELLAASGGTDLVILDLNMPGWNGLETLQRLRSGHPKLPVMVVTGFLDPGTQTELAADPCASAITKPFTMAELTGAIAKATEQGRA